MGHLGICNKKIGRGHLLLDSKEAASPPDTAVQKASPSVWQGQRAPMRPSSGSARKSPPPFPHSDRIFPKGSNTRKRRTQRSPRNARDRDCSQQRPTPSTNPTRLQTDAFHTHDHGTRKEDPVCQALSAICLQNSSEVGFSQTLGQWRDPVTYLPSDSCVPKQRESVQPLGLLGNGDGQETPGKAGLRAHTVEGRETLN